PNCSTDVLPISRDTTTTRYIALVGTSWVRKVDGAVKTDWLRCVAVFVSMLRRQRPKGGTAQVSLPQPAPGILSIWVRLVGLRRKNVD
ncbi:hypothetical protein, partial [Cupriavidus metallidurans]|uniref:hypothetical protein n=1 Tax=Cupriavidus metallidurans TaxID=119219 RepID=UPI001BDCA9FC